MYLIYRKKYRWAAKMGRQKYISNERTGEISRKTIEKGGKQSTTYRVQNNYKNAQGT